MPEGAVRFELEASEIAQALAEGASMEVEAMPDVDVSAWLARACWGGWGCSRAMGSRRLGGVALLDPPSPH